MLVYEVSSIWHPPWSGEVTKYLSWFAKLSSLSFFRRFVTLDLWKVAPAIDYLTNNLNVFAVGGRSGLPDQAPCGISASLMSSSQSLTSFVFSKLPALLVIMGKLVKLLCTFSLAPESWHGFELRSLRGLISGRLYFWVKRHLKGLSVREGQTDFWLAGVWPFGPVPDRMASGIRHAYRWRWVVPRAWLQISVC